MYIYIIHTHIHSLSLSLSMRVVMVSTFYPKANNPPQRIGASLAQRAGLTLWTQPPGFSPDDIINFQVTAPRSIFPQQHIHHPGLQNKFMNYDYMFSQFEGSPGQ